ncbi:MAG: hypothetical protein ABWX56_06315, partial [Mycetocola sp.]
PVVRHDWGVRNRFFARWRRRAPVVTAPSQDEVYSPAPEGEAILGTGADQLRAYLMTHPTRAAALEAACLPLRDRLSASSGPDAASDEIATLLPHTSQAVTSNDPTIWDAVFTDLGEATQGGPGITLSPLVVLMSTAISRSVYESEDEGLLFVASEARSVADRLLAEVEGIDAIVAELMAISRDTIAARATQAGLESVLVHRRFRMTETLDAVQLHQLESLPSADLVTAVADDLDFHTLSVWFGDIAIPRNWSPAADPASTSVAVLSVRVPVSSIWLAPRRDNSEFLISAESLVPEHVEVLNRD